MANAILLASCAHQILIKTEPQGARVTLISETNKPGTPLGTTPLILKSLPGDDSALLEFEKEGFLPRQVLVPKVPGASISLSTRLQPLTREFLAEKNRRDFASSLNDNLSQILKLQALILARKKDEVTKLSATMRQEWDDVSLFHSLMGNHFYLQANFPEARKHYEKALTLDPKNDEARAMLAGLR